MVMFWGNITSIILQVTLIVVFISIFFFVYTSVIESNVIVMQVDNLISSFTNGIDLLSDDSDKDRLREFFSKMKVEDMSSQDLDVEKNNKVVRDSTAKIISIVFVVGVSVSVYLMWVLKLDWKTILKESFSGLIAVMCIEYIFLTFFVQNYRSLDPNSVKLHLINILQNYSNS